MRVGNVKWMALAGALLLAAGMSATAQTKDKLRLILIDVEGGQSTLFVTPAGQSLLIDTGWPGNAGRDADRIVAAAKSLGLTKLDYVLITHFHDDHVGGVPQLVARIPVGTFIDHGANRELDHGDVEHNYSEYQKTLAASGAHHIVAKPGDLLPIAGITATVVSADGELIAKPLPGAGAKNAACTTSPTKPKDETENARSLGIEISFGKLRVLDLGDLTWDKERELMCPVNKLGKIDLLVVSHHGWLQSSSPALVHAIRPRVAIMDNGEKKGGSPGPLDTIKSSPGLEALYQLHYSAESLEKNTADELIANPKGTDVGFAIEVSASRDGHFTVTNDRTKVSRSF